jgi:hypothetical protein
MDNMEQLARERMTAHGLGTGEAQIEQWQQFNRWYGILKVLSLFPNPFQNQFLAYVAETDNQMRGVIQVEPFNQTRSTWKINQLLTASAPPDSNGQHTLAMDIGSDLMRYCFQTIWEARTWLIEVNVNDKALIALYRHNGFQPLAQLTYWAIAPEQIKTLAEREPDLPNLLPVSNADACLLHQLDTVAMPPLVRQVFDRHISDFKFGLSKSLVKSVRQRFDNTEIVRGYVFEPQRKAAIGFYKINLCRDGSKPHVAELTVHPAYTWLYPEMMAQMARVAQAMPSQVLHIVSTDYQPEREEYLERIGASRIEHTLMMSRSVWHKVRESRLVSLENLQLADVLQGLQPSRKPVPGRFSFIDSLSDIPQQLKRPEGNAGRAEQPDSDSMPDA